jgi:hypothetical protein
VTLVEQVKARHKDGRAIERSSSTGVLLVGAAGLCGIEERVVTYHVTAHIVRPFKDLGTDVHQERVREPPSKDHDLVDGVVIEE